jgi:hypothetical protein
MIFEVVKKSALSDATLTMEKQDIGSRIMNSSQELFDDFFPVHETLARQRSFRDFVLHAPRPEWFYVRPS